MPIGYLQISVYVAGNYGKPATTASVQVTEKDNATNVIESFETDSSGQTLPLELETPPLEYSQQPNLPKPYSEYDVYIDFEGYERMIVKGVQILPNSIAEQNITLEPKQTSTDNEIQQKIDIAPPVLFGDYPSKIPEEEEKTLPNATGFVVLPQPVVPSHIIVHAGAPDNKSAPNYTVPFVEYIKNVASCEIYCTWPEQSIIANVLAIISFTLNRVYTEWYRSKGYDFTITNSTAFDHAFSYGRNIFKEISVVVDEIFNNYITRPNIRQPLFTQYCDGKKVSCPGWMTQWGSKDLGDKGYDAIGILKNFYGNDVYLEQANKVEGIPSSYPGAVLQTGSSGPNVRTIQEQLNEIANNYPAIGKTPVDGLYGEKTRDAVTKFQEIFKLSQNGIIDSATWYKISYIYVAVKKLAELL